MKRIANFRQHESAEHQIWDLEDICQEIKDEGFSVAINGAEWGAAPSGLASARIEITNGTRKGTGISGSNFTMVRPMRDFLFRLQQWSRGEGYEPYITSNYGPIRLAEDGRIMGTGCTCTPRYPGFTKLSILFAR